MRLPMLLALSKQAEVKRVHVNKAYKNVFTQARNLIEQVSKIMC